MCEGNAHMNGRGCFCYPAFLIDNRNNISHMHLPFNEKFCNIKVSKYCDTVKYFYKF